MATIEELEIKLQRIERLLSAYISAYHEMNKTMDIVTENQNRQNQLIEHLGKAELMRLQQEKASSSSN